MSQYDLDSQEISRIQFHTDFDRKTKNKMMSKIERRMEKMEERENNGINTGYYT